MNLSSLQHEICVDVLLVSLCPDALSQQTAHSPAEPENSPGHMRVFVSGGAEGKKAGKAPIGVFTILLKGCRVLHWVGYPQCIFEGQVRSLELCNNKLRE